MEKYNSRHFSSDHYRGIIMPDCAKGDKYVPARYRNPANRPLYPEYTPEMLNPTDPYYQPNLGKTRKTININGTDRNYLIYVPDGLRTKAPCIVLFPNSGEKAEDVLDGGSWKELAHRHHFSMIVLESTGWDAGAIEWEFDYAHGVIKKEFSQRLTVDIGEAFIYPLGLGDGARIATAFALVYSEAFPAFAADGDCGVDPELLAVLETMPSERGAAYPKKEVPISAFLIDRSGEADPVAEYLTGTINARDEGLYNAFGNVYLERPKRGAYFVNAQPVSQIWTAQEEQIKGLSRDQLNEEMVKFLLRFARWGGFGNGHLRERKPFEGSGVLRVEKEVEGLKRMWDVFLPSCYRPDDGKVYPLVVATHGVSCNSEYFLQTSDWHRLAEERGFIVCFSYAYPRNDGFGHFPIPHWALTGMGKETDEIPYFVAMLDHMEANYNIDRRRIYAVGHSNGSQMTQELAHRIPERFAAFGPAGRLAGFTAEEVRPLPDKVPRPIWFIMGQYDIVYSDLDDGGPAKATLEAYCAANDVEPRYDNWYDNGNYKTWVMRDKTGVPMVCYTIAYGSPHTYTAEQAQLTWDCFLCHFTREEDGSITYHG